MSKSPISWSDAVEDLTVKLAASVARAEKAETRAAEAEQERDRLRTVVAAWEDLFPATSWSFAEADKCLESFVRGPLLRQNEAQQERIAALEAEQVTAKEAIRSLADGSANLHAELAEERGRLDWLQNNLYYAEICSGSIEMDFVGSPYGPLVYEGKDFRRAIDTARKPKGAAANYSRKAPETPASDAQ